jgi:hypothetical protein
LNAEVARRTMFSADSVLQRSIGVIASHPVRAKRGRMTSSAKQSRVRGRSGLLPPSPVGLRRTSLRLRSSQ